MALVENKTMGARAVFAVALLLFSVFGMGGCSGEVSVDQKFVDLFVELRVAEITRSPASWRDIRLRTPCFDKF